MQLLHLLRVPLLQLLLVLLVLLFYMLLPRFVLLLRRLLILSLLLLHQLLMFCILFGHQLLLLLLILLVQLRIAGIRWCHLVLRQIRCVRRVRWSSPAVRGSRLCSSPRRRMIRRPGFSCFNDAAAGQLARP